MATKVFEKKMIGRPPKYKPEYCKKLIAHMAKGKSYESFSVQLGTCRDTLYQWEKNYPEFSDAKKAAIEACQDFWETKAIDHITHTSKGKQLNTSAWIFNMKNRFNWTDKREVEVGDKTRDALKLSYSLDDEGGDDA